MNKRRYDFIDVARGLAMLVVINWHILNYHSPYIDGWTMPIFFIIMGIFYKQEPSFWKMLIKKINTILVPYIYFSIPAFIIGFSETPLKSFVLRILNPYQCINSNSWFLICMFNCYLMYYIINAVSANKKYIKIIISVLISLSGFYMNYIPIYGHRCVLPFFLSTSMTCVIFILLGDTLKSYLLKIQCNKKSFLFLILFAFITVSGIWLWGCKPLEMIWNNYQQNYFIIIVNAMLGSITIFFISAFFKIYPIQLIGKYSLVMLVLHSYFIRIYSDIISNSLILYILVVSTTLFIAHLLYKYTPAIVGQKPLFKLN